ncbi:uncharacterized protein LOC133201971 [Saccostrea echinata]|uniref:uncharacterized protein LOC133201971 n=1 Tax=Saccostrea echinata TaxID=191078 RepID=UPI002A825632|nr:uncharacterized protein LOC133201971 [Saccostrea echinata]
MTLLCYKYDRVTIGRGILEEMEKYSEDQSAKEERMTKNRFMVCCRATRPLRVRVICILIILLHIAVVDYHMVEHESIALLGFLAVDVISLILFVASFILSCLRFKSLNGNMPMRKINIWLDVISWFVFSATVMTKSVIIFSDFEDENLIFGPNAVKTAFALVGVVFVLHLSTLHDAKPGSERKAYIEELSTHVIFDIMDCVDSMEPLFIKEDRAEFPPGLIKAIVAVASFNFVLPTIPLLTLSLTRFGHAKLPRRLIVLHKILHAYIVNLPLLLMRIILWHEFNKGISVFSLKNVIVIVATSYEFYKHYETEKLQKVDDNAES